MKAIEFNLKTDSLGNLKLDLSLNQIDKRVRVLVLFQDEDDIDNEQKWLYAISENPSFDFLNEPGEDVYTMNNGLPYRNEK
jgi:hypothetical protein